MARIRVYRNEADGEDFPRLCMRCGEPAECDVPQTFSWMPGWVYAFLLLGLCPLLVAALITRKSMRVVAPMCLQHAGHWRVRKLFVGVGLFLCVAAFVGLAAVGDQLPEGVVVPAVAVTLLAALGWLIGGLVLSNNAIKAKVIGKSSMDLVNIHRGFADAWNDLEE
jgi:hypothetical protein